MNYKVAITTDESSRRYLSEKLDWLLDFMDKERQHATTHAQRNSYQAVIRIELEIMRDELRYAYTSEGGIRKVESDDIPFDDITRDNGQNHT